MRKNSPQPEAKAKFVAMPQLVRQAEVKASATSFDSSADILRRERKGGPSALMLPSLGKGNPRPSEPASPLALREDRVLNVNIESDKPAILERYRYLVRSPNIDSDKLLNYLVLCIRGLHYSTMCLKEPSKKFIESRKVKIADPKLRRLALRQLVTRHCTLTSMKLLYSKSKTRLLRRTLRWQQRQERWYASMT